MKRRIVATVLAILLSCVLVIQGQAALTADIPQEQYTADGAGTAFLFTWPIWKSTEMLVYDNDTLVSSSLYAVTFTAGDPLGGTVTFTTAPTAGHTVTLERRSEQARTTDFALSGPFSMSTMNSQLDKLTAQTQDLQVQMDSALQMAPSATSTPPTFPNAQTGAWIRWDASGNFENFLCVIGECTVDDAELQSYVDEFLGDVNYSQGLLAADPTVTDQGDTGETGSLAAVFVTLAGDPASIEMPGNSTYTATTALTVPGGIEMRFQRGAVLDGTITWPNTFPAASILAAPDQKIFAATLTQTYFPAVDVIHPGWWGCYPDGTTDCTAGLQAAIDQAGLGSTIQLLSGTYLISGELKLLSSGIHIRGSSVDTSKIKQTTTGENIFHIGDGTNPDVKYLTIEHVTLEADADSGHIFEMFGTGGLYDSTFRHVYLKQDNPAKRIFINSDKGDYVNVVWDHFVFEHSASGAVNPFLLETNNDEFSLGYFTNGTLRGANTQFFWLSALLTGYFVNDFTFRSIRVEDGNSGLLYCLDANNLIIENVGFSVTTTTQHLIEIANSLDISQNITIRNVTRHGGALGSGKYDILLDPSGVTGVLIEMVMDDNFTNYKVNLGNNFGVTIIDPLSTTTWDNVDEQTIRINPKTRSVLFGPTAFVRGLTDGSTGLETSGAVHAGGLVYDARTKSSPGTGDVSITAAHLLSGVVDQDPVGSRNCLSGVVDQDPVGSRNWTLPSAASVVALIPDAAVNDTFFCIFHNAATEGSAEIVSLFAGTGMTFHGNSFKLREGQRDVLVGNENALLFFRLTNVTGGTEAIDVYSITADGL
jgi:hypothetical protein